jgi:membrane protease YdiL (CAAX protease family)
LLHTREGFDVAEPLLVLGIIGIGFSGLALLAARGTGALRVPVHEPRNESALLLAYVALVLVPWLAFGAGRVRGWTSSPAVAEVFVMVAKLAVFVVLPFVLLARRGYGLRDFLAGWGRGHTRVLLVVSAGALAFQAVFGRGLHELEALAISPSRLAVGAVLGLAWLAVEAGLVEELFFRALVQERAAALLRSEAAGIVVMAVVFGLAHAPGLYLRTAATQEGLSANPSLLAAVGYSIVFTSAAGLFFGVLWARTRNLALVCLAHAAFDLLPNLAPWLRTFGLA